MNLSDDSSLIANGAENFRHRLNMLMSLEMVPAVLQTVLALLVDRWGLATVEVNVNKHELPTFWCVWRPV